MNDPSFRDVEEYWMHIDRIMADKLRSIQCQGPDWEDHPDHVPNEQVRTLLVDKLQTELVAELNEAVEAIERLGYPDAATEGRVLRDMVKVGDVRQHEIRAAITAYHHQFHPAQHFIAK